MLRFELADTTLSEIVASIIRKSFKNQAEELGLTVEKHSGYAAFETSQKVKRRIGRGEHVFLAYVGEEPVGTITFSVDSKQPVNGYIERLAVLPEFRGNGYGRELMGYAEEQLRKASVVCVELAIVKQFKSLQEFYEQLGYNPTETVKYEFLPFEVLLIQNNYYTHLALIILLRNISPREGLFIINLNPMNILSIMDFNGLLMNATRLKLPQKQLVEQMQLLLNTIFTRQHLDKPTGKRHLSLMKIVLFFILLQMRLGVEISHTILRSL